MPKEKVNTNASPSAYGWVFQVGAGITLMLDNIKDFTAVKMEGKSDDIEISCPNGKIYAQAKSVTQIGNQKSASKNLKAALNMLDSDSKNGDAIQLIYITNIINPLSSQYASVFQYGHSYNYSNLSDEDKSKVDSYVGKDFPKEKLQIHIINFFGEGMNKFDSVKEKISIFLQNALNDSSYNQKLLESWFSTFMVNCSDIPDEQKECTLTKRDIILPVMVLVMEQLVSEDDFAKVSDYDDMEELKREFRILIDRKICDCEFISSVIGEFLSKKTLDGHSVSKYEYVQNNWKNYEIDFLHISDTEKREAIIKLILLTAITKRSKINKIKEASNL